MRAASYYADAIERALGLMRQGANSKAMTLLQDALDEKLDAVLPGDPEPLQLAFNPRIEEITIPDFWIDRQSHQLVINSEGWEIDPLFLEHCVREARDPALWSMGEAERKRVVLEQVGSRLRLGVKSGSVRKKQ